MDIKEYQQWLAFLKVGDKVSRQSKNNLAELTERLDQQYVYVQAWVIEVSDFIYVRTYRKPPKFSMEYWHGYGDTAQFFCKLTGKDVYINTDNVNGYYQLVPFQETNGEELTYLDKSIYPLN